MPVATAALSDSTARAIGMEATTSQVSRTRRDRPAPSAPVTATSGASASARSSRAVSPSPSSPTTKQPSFFRAVRVRTRFVSRATGTRAAAPAETFHTVALTPTDRRSGMMTPSAPKAPADRRTAPRLCGSVTWSRATSSGVRPASRARSSRPAASAYS